MASGEYPVPTQSRRTRRCDATEVIRDDLDDTGDPVIYTATMPSVADELRRRTIDDLRSRTASERVRIALELGDFDLELFCARHEIAPEVASERMRRSRHRGRRASVAGEPVKYSIP